MSRPRDAKSSTQEGAARALAEHDRARLHFRRAVAEQRDAAQDLRQLGGERSQAALRSVALRVGAEVRCELAGDRRVDGREIARRPRRPRRLARRRRASSPATRRSVTPETAEATTPTRSASAAPATRSATPRMRSAPATEVPPNFMTRKDGRIDCMPLSLSLPQKKKPRYLVGGAGPVTAPSAPSARSRRSPRRAPSLRSRGGSSSCTTSTAGADRQLARSHHAEDATAVVRPLSNAGPAGRPRQRKGKRLAPLRNQAFSLPWRGGRVSRSRPPGRWRSCR